jgi:general secretion pathway protein A
MMYQAHWGLKESPFRGCIDPKSFYQSPTHEEALARLHFLAEQHRRLGLLVGPAGSGKSLLLQVFAGQLLRRGCPVAKISLLDIDPMEMLWRLASEWGLNPDPSSSAASLWRAVGDRLTECRYQRLETVVLLDDADQADYDVWMHVARLARFDPSPDMWLTIVLAGHNDILVRLDDSLAGLADLRIDVEPWQPSDTRGFVDTRLSQAGGRGTVFTQSAVERLHEASGGIPRRAAQLADLALLAGAGQNLNCIDAELVDSVEQELGVGV